ncbi:MAG: nucleotidyltransferase domain-containing protein [Solirubrobacteraceae bacterium]
MTWRVPPYDRAAAEVEAYVRATYAPIGIVIAGSIVRGEGGPLSDLDVCVVHEPAWRVREQRRFAGVPVELFVNSAAQVRRYFASEHREGKPSTAHMWTTGEPIAPVAPVIRELIAEAHDWMARPVEITPEGLAAQRYGAVDVLDDARDVIAVDPAAASLLLAEAVRSIVGYAFWKRARFQPRRKDAVRALAAIDPEAAALVRRWAACGAAAMPEALAAVEALARHVQGDDTCFDWISERDIPPDSPPRS